MTPDSAGIVERTDADLLRLIARDVARWPCNSNCDGAPSSADTLRDIADNIEAQAVEILRLRQALEDVASPLGEMRRKAGAKGRTLPGMAYIIANDIAYVQRIARAALKGAKL